VSDAIKIDIWSDIACPWCYIGKRKLEYGIAEYDGDEGALPVEIEYHSFELSPDTPVDFHGSHEEFLATKGFPPEQIAPMLERVTGIAASVGLDYDYPNLKHANTVLAHQLIHYAKARGLQLEAKERLLKAYFVEGRQVGTIDGLADLAVELGFDRDDVVRSLSSNEYLADVRADQQTAIAYGIQGVPFFVIEGKYGVSGAQDPATFAQVLRQVTDEKTEVGA
jgi:predicted DsbA family dithiol-disulfide isomerase